MQRIQLVTNAIAALLTTILVEVNDPVFLYIIECLSVHSANDVIRPCPPSSFVTQIYTVKYVM